MAAYAAVISLKNTINHIMLSSGISLVGTSLGIIQLAYEELQPLQEILERLDGTSKSRSRKKVNASDGRIKETLWKFEDSLESLFSDQIISQLKSSQDQLILRRKIRRRRRRRIRILCKSKGEESHLSSPQHRRKFLMQKKESQASQSRSSGSGGERDELLFSIDLQRLQDDVHYFIKTLMHAKEEYIYELENMAEDEDDEYSIPSRACFGGMKSKMIGLSDQFQEVKQSLQRSRVRRTPCAILGMAGIGKTTLAMEIFQDPEILGLFQCRAWVTVGRKPQLDQLSRSILARLTQGDDNLNETLEGQKCLIVLDDVWEKHVLDSLTNSLPEINDGVIQILLTARTRKACKIFLKRGYFSEEINVRFLNIEESKDLLCDKVFGEEICPPQLDKAARKIAKNCEGLPLMIVTVADLLSQAQNTDPEYWEDVAEQRNSVFTDAYNQISEVLFPSYEYLPQHLRMLFLFMGAFPPDYDIPRSKIVNMLNAGGWLLDTSKELDDPVLRRLYELKRCYFLVLFNTTRPFWTTKNLDSVFKTCRLHSSFRHLCRREARRNKFYDALTRLVDDGLEEDIKGQRCLCLQNNILFGFKEFCDLVRCNCASSTRSLLFFGPYHPYPTPIDVGFKLLRELDALQLRFYTFPTEILTLVQLKYLALTCNGQLPTAISKLFNLKILIIHPHMNIQRCGAPSYIPIQIWDMQELEHIEILGKTLRAPYHVVSLRKLSTLVGVNANICTILELSKRIPNIRKLGVEIELAPYDDNSNLLSCFHCISTLSSLETLRCSIINPIIKCEYWTPSSLMFPHGLTKLHLSGMGFPWEYMDDIGSLPYLHVLKLKSYAFRGPKWEPQEGSFLWLEFLIIEGSDLVQWKPTSGSFPKIQQLSMKHCYKLEELHWSFLCPAGEIELVDCNPLAFNFVKKLQPKRGSRLTVTTSVTFFGEQPITTKLVLRAGTDILGARRKGKKGSLKK